MIRALSILGYLGMVAGILTLMASHQLFSPAPWVIALQVAAVALMIWARITFGRRSFHPAANTTAGELVTTGPYHYIRHPIYTSVCLFTAASLAAYLSWLAALGYALILAGALTRMLCEEKFLVKSYPQYQSYAASTRRMIPFIF